MRCVRRTENGIEVRDVPVPTDEGVRVHVRAVGICQTDVNLARMGPMPQTLGHEFAGVVESLIKPSKKGKKPPAQIYRHDKARDALKSGRIVSLSVIRKRVTQSFPGKIVDVRLIEPKRKSQPYMYIVKLLRKDGKLLELKINATNATIISVKGNV